MLFYTAPRLNPSLAALAERREPPCGSPAAGNSPSVVRPRVCLPGEDHATPHGGGDQVVCASRLGTHGGSSVVVIGVCGLGEPVAGLAVARMPVHRSIADHVLDLVQVG